ncbi:HAD family hydrolase [Gracilibacillus caseinilyticus]|uniref:HAD family hydrolase n=1 Tax=Gracilibacillus caseinilyticus TaxID=2932256 RepID=A0ABY4F3E4_9BACI|nr:HAD family hydrolase [Gracilibacillus caseinilyticus]UOQ50582.1 HAD family hydrolase [Gracilibacillus caseinilyticus]
MKAFFVDFYGTIVQEDGAIISNICKKIKENSNTEATLSEISSFWWNNFSDLARQSFLGKFQTQRYIETTSLESTLLHFGSSLNAADISELMFNYWMKPAIYDDAAEFMKINTIPIYILSNIDTFDIRKAIEFHQLNVTEVITSEDVKSYKPRPEMFAHALKISGLSKDEVIHVGDSLSSDIGGANNAGVRSVWINRNNKDCREEDKPDYVISSLTELHNLEISV